jgi:hypothetical protein
MLVNVLLVMLVNVFIRCIYYTWSHLCLLYLDTDVFIIPGYICIYYYFYSG